MERAREVIKDREKLKRNLMEVMMSILCMSEDLSSFSPFYLDSITLSP